MQIEEQLAAEHAAMLRLMADGLLRWEPFHGSADRGELRFNGLRYCSELDHFGCPRMTEALAANILKFHNQ